MYWSVSAELCIRTYTTGVLTVYWIPCIQFHSGYVRLVWFCCTHCILDYLDTVPQWLRQADLALLYSLRTGLLGYSSTAVTSGWFGYCWCTHCVLDYLDIFPRWLRQAGLVLLYSLRTGLLGYSSTVITSGWFGSAVLTAYWITWIQFHSGYVTLVSFLIVCFAGFCSIIFFDSLCKANKLCWGIP